MNDLPSPADYGSGVARTGVGKVMAGTTYIEAEEASGIDNPLEKLTHVVVNALDAKRGRHVVVLDISRLFGIVDLFVIATGASKRQVRTLAEEVDKKLEEQGRTPLRVEGRDTAEWVLLDYGELVIHVFQPESRRFYGLERLWGDARRVYPTEPDAEEVRSKGS